MALRMKTSCFLLLSYILQLHIAVIAQEFDSDCFELGQKMYGRTNNKFLDTEV